MFTLCAATLCSNTLAIALIPLPSSSLRSAIKTLTTRDISEMQCARLTTALLAAATFNDATVYHVSEVISTVM